jgi:hypothetical protein
MLHPAGVWQLPQSIPWVIELWRAAREAASDLSGSLAMAIPAAAARAATHSPTTIARLIGDPFSEHGGSRGNQRIRDTRADT